MDEPDLRICHLIHVHARIIKFHKLGMNKFALFIYHELYRLEYGDELCYGHRDYFLLFALIFVFNRVIESVDSVLMQSRSYEQAITLFRIPFFKLPKMSHDGLAFVEPLIARGQHGYFAYCVEFFVKTFDVSHATRRSICRLVVIAYRSVGL